MLLALITYFALTGWRSRSPNGLARSLALDEKSIMDTLVEFPGLFRKGHLYETDSGPQHSYTLHARYARRRPETGTADGTGEELDAETLRALLDFVSDQARAEREARYQRRSQVWLAVGVAVAAVASVTAALIQALA